jgi:hypothetical protein
LPAGAAAAEAADVQSEDEDELVRESADAAFERIRLPTEARAREALIADLRYRQRAARMAPPSDAYRRPSLADAEARTARGGADAGGGGPEGPESAAGAGTPAVPEAPLITPVLMGEPPLPMRRLAAQRRRNWRILWWTLAVVALLGVLAAGWYILGQRREARREPVEAATAGALEPPATLPQPAREPAAVPAADTVLAYVVSLGEHVRLPTAEQRVTQLRASLGGTRFFVSPVVRDGALYYEVLTGPAADSATAFAMRDSVVAKGGAQPGQAVVRLAPYAFLLGEYAAANLAEARVANLRRLEIPSYLVPAAGPPARVRVYAGGYTGPVDAEVMRQILQSVGEPDVLVPRKGQR